MRLKSFRIVWTPRVFARKRVLCDGSVLLAWCAESKTRQLACFLTAVCYCPILYVWRTVILRVTRGARIAATIPTSPAVNSNKPIVSPSIRIAMISIVTILCVCPNFT